MSYTMFLDDERFPVDQTSIVCRSGEEAIEYMIQHGCPAHIDFDNDLGPDRMEGRDIARWLIERDLDDNGTFIPGSFTFAVHSQNPIAASAIRSLIEHWLSVRHRRYV